jgi:hypothetical protein
LAFPMEPVLEFCLERVPPLPPWAVVSGTCWSPPSQFTIGRMMVMRKICNQASRPPIPYLNMARKARVFKEFFWGKPYGGLWQPKFLPDAIALLRLLQQQAYEEIRSNVFQAVGRRFSTDLVYEILDWALVAEQIPKRQKQTDLPRGQHYTSQGYNARMYNARKEELLFWRSL